MSNVTRTFTLDQLKEWDAPYNDEVWSETEDVGRRWMDLRTVVFKAPDDGLLYQIAFSVGKTENQWVHWSEDFDGPEITLPRVERGVRVIEEEYWRPVEA